MPCFGTEVHKRVEGLPIDLAEFAASISMSVDRESRLEFIGVVVDHPEPVRVGIHVAEIRLEVRHRALDQLVLRESRISVVEGLVFLRIIFELEPGNLVSLFRRFKPREDYTQIVCSNEILNISLVYGILKPPQDLVLVDVVII